MKTEDSALSKEVATLDLGTEIVILKAQNDILNVKTTTGQQGWTRGCWVCSLPVAYTYENNENIRGLYARNRHDGTRFAGGLRLEPCRAHAILLGATPAVGTNSTIVGYQRALDRWKVDGNGNRESKIRLTPEPDHGG